MRKMINVSCSHCQTVYQLAKNKYDCGIKRGTVNHFCSSSCHQLYRKAQMIPNSTCLRCDQAFYRPTCLLNRTAFCSSSCAAKRNNRGVQRNPPKPRTCAKCETVFYRTKSSRNRACCQSCYEPRDRSKHKRTLKECQNKNSLSGKHPSWKSSYVRQACYSLNKAIKDSPCQFCGYAAHTELCHIKPVSSFDETATLNEVNHPDNILVLCSNHHWEFDNGKILLGDIPKRIP